jgi:hypothetical protein
MMTKRALFRAGLIAVAAAAFGAVVWDANLRERAEERAWLQSCGADLNPERCLLLYRWATDGRTDAAPPWAPAA